MSGPGLVGGSLAIVQHIKSMIWIVNCVAQEAGAEANTAIGALLNQSLATRRVYDEQANKRRTTILGYIKVFV